MTMITMMMMMMMMMMMGTVDGSWDDTKRQQTQSSAISGMQ